MKGKRDFSFDRALLENGYPLNPETVNRGNRYTYGFEYKIRGLDSPSIPKVKNDPDAEEAEEKVHVGDLVTGISDKTHRKHIGRVVNFIWDDETQQDNNPTYILVVDDETSETIPLLPNSLRKIEPEPVNGNHHMNPFATNYGRTNAFYESALFGRDEEETDYNYRTDDHIYRQKLIDTYNINQRFINYWDKKYYTDLFKEPYFEIFGIELANIVAQLWGVEFTKDSDNRPLLKRLVKKFLLYYKNMTGQDFELPDKIEFIPSDGWIRVYYEDHKHPALVRSWKEMYYYLEAIKRIHAWVIASPNNHYVPTGRTHYKSWNVSPQTQTYKDHLYNVMKYNFHNKPEYMYNKKTGLYDKRVFSLTEINNNI